MSFDLPSAATPWLGKVWRGNARRIGQKCRLVYLPDEEGDWTELGGFVPGEEWLEYIDTNQARVYYRQKKDDQIPECHIVIPEDSPFRRSRKGFRQKWALSFDANGNPVREVLLLYALKTKDLLDRIKAVGEFPDWEWGIAQGEIFEEMDYACKSPERFAEFAGSYLARAAVERGGLSVWAGWEAVADAAVEEKLDRMSKSRTHVDQSNHELFLKAVKAATIKSGGFPAQKDIRHLWERNGGIGEWREIRKTLGFDWLPSATDVQKYRGGG